MDKPFKQFTYKFPLNSRNGSNTLHEVAITIRVEPEQESLETILDGVDESLRDMLKRDIVSGKVDVCSVSVTAVYAGIEGFDSLGMCHITSPLQVEQDIIGYHSMVENACETLVKNMLETYSKLNEVFNEKTK